MSRVLKVLFVVLAAVLGVSAQTQITSTKMSNITINGQNQTNPVIRVGLNLSFLDSVDTNSNNNVGLSLSLPSAFSVSSQTNGGPNPTLTLATLPSVQVKSNGTSFESLSLSLTTTPNVAAQTGGTCGPPTYSCSSTSTANPGVITALFNSTTPGNSATCSGDCQNSTKYDTTINPTGTDCYTRITDGVVLNGASIGNLTNSGGDNDVMWSKNSTYVAALAVGAFNKFFQLTRVGDCVQVVNTGVPAISIAKPIAFSRTTDNVFYGITSNHILQKYTIASINSVPTPTTLFDFTAAGNCPGIPSSMTITGTGILVPNNTDTRFTIELQTGVQNTDIWVASYDTTLGCSTANWQTGQVWDWCLSSCSSSTTPLGTFPTTGDSCWGASPTASGGGIHDGFPSFNGDYYFITLNGTWTQGACAGNASGNQFISWKVGTLNNTWCNDSSSSTTGACASHSSAGVSSVAAPSFHGYNTRLLSNLGGGFTAFLPSSFVPDDIHQTWPHPTGDDSYPWPGATDAVHAGATRESGCSTSSVYCPTYPQNMIVAVFPNQTNAPVKVFGHTFSCNPSGGTLGHCTDAIADGFGPGNSIGNVSQDGKYFLYVSSMLHGMGNDNTAAPRTDAFIVTLD